MAKAKLPDVKAFSEQLASTKKPLKLDRLSPSDLAWLKKILAAWGQGKIPDCSWAELARRLAPRFNGTLTYDTVHSYAKRRWPDLCQAVDAFEEDAD